MTDRKLFLDDLRMPTDVFLYSKDEIYIHSMNLVGSKNIYELFLSYFKVL